MSLFEQLPNTEFSLNRWIMYAENELKEIKKKEKRIVKQMAEAVRRLEVIKNGKV